MTPQPLPAGIASRMIPGINGLDMHILEAGDPSHPCLLLLHGFPELAFSWRKVMLPLAALGYHVIAPDQRGYGRTTGWSDAYEGDRAPFRRFNLVRDVLGLLHALGLSQSSTVNNLRKSGTVLSALVGLVAAVRLIVIGVGSL